MLDDNENGNFENSLKPIILTSFIYWINKKNLE